MSPYTSSGFGSVQEAQHIPMFGTGLLDCSSQTVLEPFTAWAYSSLVTSVPTILKLLCRLCAFAGAQEAAQLDHINGGCLWRGGEILNISTSRDLA